MPDTAGTWVSDVRFDVLSILFEAGNTTYTYNRLFGFFMPPLKFF